EEVSTPAVAAEPRVGDTELPVRPLDPPSIPPGALTAEPKSSHGHERQAPVADEPKPERTYAREPTTDELAAAAGLPRRDVEYTVLRRVGYALRPVVVVTGAAMAAFMGMNQV